VRRLEITRDDDEVTSVEQGCPVHEVGRDVDRGCDEGTLHGWITPSRVRTTSAAMTVPKSVAQKM
jgi:hypothetical protein